MRTLHSGMYVYVSTFTCMDSARVSSHLLGGGGGGGGGAKKR